MGILFVLTYMVKYENRTKFQALVKRFLKLKKENPKTFDGLKSWRLFQREYGGVAGSYVEMWEFKSIEEMEKVTATMMKNKEMKDIDTEFHKIIDHKRLRSQSGILLRRLRIASIEDSSIFLTQFLAMRKSYSRIRVICC